MYIFLYTVTTVNEFTLMFISKMPNLLRAINHTFYLIFFIKVQLKYNNKGFK